MREMREGEDLRLGEEDSRIEIIVGTDLETADRLRGVTETLTEALTENQTDTGVTDLRKGENPSEVQIRIPENPSGGIAIPGNGQIGTSLEEEVRREGNTLVKHQSKSQE